jgi:serine/threonine protein phosphatase 1
MYIYAFSDIHGRFDAFNKSLDLIDLNEDNKLVLFGNFIGEGSDNPAILDKIISLEKQYGTDRIIVILGGKEVSAINNETADKNGFYENNQTYINWLKKHNYYCIVDNCIFYNNDVSERVKTERENTLKTSTDATVISDNNFKEGLIEYELISETESQDFILPNVIEENPYYTIISSSEPCERLTTLVKEFGERYSFYEFNEKGKKFGVDSLRALIYHYQANKIFYCQKVRYGKYARSADYFDVTEETEQILLPLAENIFGNILFAKNSFEARQKQEAIICLDYLLSAGADEELLTGFEAGKLNCVYPKDDKSIELHERYKKAVEVFYKLYKSENGKKPLVYLCVPTGNMLNLLYTGTDEGLFSNRRVRVFDDIIVDIDSFVFNSFIAPDDLTGNEKLDDFGDFCKITYQTNKTGLLYCHFKNREQITEEKIDKGENIGV